MYKAVLKEFEEKIKKSILVYKDELGKIRAGRANPALVEKISVNYYGTETPLQQVASISVPEARLLVIQPWDASLISEVEKAILKSDLGITPSNDGKLIRLPFPALTEDRRRDLAKQAKKVAENAKIVLRNLRKDAIDRVKKLEKDESMPEDQRKLAEEEIQTLVDKYNKEIDVILKEKEEELMEI